MVYIDRNGSVLEKRPWNMARIIGIFVGIWLLVVRFFQTLIGPFNHDSGYGRRGGGWGSRGGYSGGGGSGGGNGGLGPNRRIGRITNSMDCNIPGGGCSSCPGST